LASVRDSEALDYGEPVAVSNNGIRRKWHYAWLIAGLTFIVLLVSAGVRTAPSVIIKPLEAEFGWDRASISLAIAVSLLAYGLGGPLAGSLIDRYGPRRVMLGGLTLITIGLTPLLWLQALWQLQAHARWRLLPLLPPGALARQLNVRIDSLRPLVVAMAGTAVAPCVLHGDAQIRASAACSPG